MRQLLPTCETLPKTEAQLELDIWNIRSINLVVRDTTDFVKQISTLYEPSNSSCIETLTSMLNCKKCWPSVRKIHELDLCYDTCKVMVGNSACFDDGVFESYSGFE